MKLAQLKYQSGKWSTPLPVMMDSKQTLITAYFNEQGEKSEIWEELKSKFPLSIVMGCSGAGEVIQGNLVDNEVVLTITQFQKTKLVAAFQSLHEEPDSEKAGMALAKQIPLDGLKAVYVLSDGLHVNGTTLIKGLRKGVGDLVLISGGLAGDGTRFQKTSVLVRGSPSEKGLMAIGFYGDQLQVVSASNGGWKPFGPLRKITKSRANVLFELDEKPALTLYKEFLGEQAKKLPASALLFPLHLISDHKKVQRDIVRTILSVDEATQSLTFAGDVPEGTTVQLMRSSHEKLIDAANDAMQKNILSLSSRSPVLSLLVSCVGRRLVLGEHTEDEIEAVFEQLPEGSVQTGFYSYGEIAPTHAGICDLHNQTMTLTLIQESE